MKQLQTLSVVLLLATASFAGSLTAWSTRSDSVVNLTTLGTLDWSAWKDTTGDVIKTVRKSGGTAISALKNAGGPTTKATAPAR